MIDPNLLMIRTSKKKASATPLVDELTRTMTAAWRRRRTDGSYRGRRVCSCGASGDNKLHWVSSDDHNGFYTYALCVHYLAFHRDIISQEELDKVRSLPSREEEPTEEELALPKR